MTSTCSPCHTRITNKHCKYFADGIHKFYLEYCCNKPCIEGQKRCKSCIKIHKGARSQFDSTYPHGHMSEPIPDHSHIFGGKWYNEHIKYWGSPSEEVIALALQYQIEARQFYNIPIHPLSKADSVSTLDNMGRPKKVVDTHVHPVKHNRKPKVGVVTNISDTTNIIAENTEVAEVISEITQKSKTPVKPKKKATKSKEAPIKIENQHICKEVVIPTHIEQKIEEIDTKDYEIEYIILTFLEVDKITYYHDAKKHKLYEIIKNKEIGPYVGRYCPHTELICADVPDSDEEKDD